MEKSIGLMLLLQLVLIAFNAVFACAEIAVISMNDNKLAKLAEAGDKRAIRLARLTNQPARFLATIRFPAFWAARSLRKTFRMFWSAGWFP